MDADLRTLSSLISTAAGQIEKFSQERDSLQATLKKQNDELADVQSSLSERKTALTRGILRHQEAHQQLNQTVARLSDKKKLIRDLTQAIEKSKARNSAQIVEFGKAMSAIGDQMDEDTASMCKRDVGALESRIASCQNAVEAHNVTTA